MQLTLTARQPFNFHSVVNSHGWVQLAPFHFDETHEALSYVDRLSNGRVLQYRITQAPNRRRRGCHRSPQQGGDRMRSRRRSNGCLGWIRISRPSIKLARIEPKLRDAKRLARGRVPALPNLLRRYPQDHPHHKHPVGGDQKDEPEPDRVVRGSLTRCQESTRGPQGFPQPGEDRVCHARYSAGGGACRISRSGHS